MVSYLFNLISWFSAVNLFDTYPNVKRHDCHHLYGSHIHCFHNCKITVNTIRSAVILLYTHTHTQTFQSALMILPPIACYVLWQTKGSLILLSLSIVSVSVLCPLPLFSSRLPHKQLKTSCSLWIGQEVVRGLLLSAVLLACPWHLGFFVLRSTSRQKPSHGR